MEMKSTTSGNPYFNNPSIHKKWPSRTWEELPGERTNPHRQLHEPLSSLSTPYVYFHSYIYPTQNDIRFITANPAGTPWHAGCWAPGEASVLTKTTRASALLSVLSQRSTSQKTLRAAYCSKNTPNAALLLHRLSWGGMCSETPTPAPNDGSS